MLARVRRFGSLLGETFAEWQADHANRLGAALAYYTAFSVAPLLVIVLAAVGLVWEGQSASVRAQVFAWVSAEVGADAAEFLQGALDATMVQADGSVWAAALGVAALLFGATTVFSQLQGALNFIWEVKPDRRRGILNFVMGRVLSFLMILGIGFLLLASLVVSTTIQGAGAYLARTFYDPEANLDLLWRWVDVALSFGVTTILFGAIYKVLPDVEIAWRDVIVGAAFTALLFVVGKFLLSLYLGRSSSGSAYGAAGAFVVLLLWIYYSAQIFFFGAEFTQVYARRRGSRIRPASYAVRLADVTQRELEERLAEAQRQVAEHASERARPPAPPPPKPRAWTLGALALGLLLGRWWGRR